MVLSECILVRPEWCESLYSGVMFYFFCHKSLPDSHRQ